MARILIVDDDEDILRLARELLLEEGHDVLTATDSLGALDILRTKIFDLMITDANMPAHSGFDLVRSMPHDIKSRMSIVMLTARREKRDVERAIRLGVKDYIVKPIDPILFIAKVRQILQKQEPEEATQVDLASADFDASAILRMGAFIKSISEIGVVLSSPHQLGEGERLDLRSILFDEIGIEVPPLRVLNSKLIGKEWETRTVFIGIDETRLQKLRAWIHSQKTRDKGVA